MIHTRIEEHFIQNSTYQVSIFTTKSYHFNMRRLNRTRFKAVNSENEIETIHSDAFDWKDFENSWYQPEIDISRTRFSNVDLTLTIHNILSENPRIAIN